MVGCLLIKHLSPSKGCLCTIHPNYNFIFYLTLCLSPSVFSIKLAPGYFFPLSTIFCRISMFYSVTFVGTERLERIFIGRATQSISISAEHPKTVLKELSTLLIIIFYLINPSFLSILFLKE